MVLLFFEVAYTRYTFYMNKRRMLYFVLAILAGVFLFVYGGYDDSPGGQLLGLALVAFGVVGLVKRKKKILNQ